MHYHYSPMTEIISHRANRAYSSATEQESSTSLTSPVSMFSHGRKTSGATRSGSPEANSTGGADTCEELLFKVIASVQGMRSERGDLLKDMKALQSENDRLNEIISAQRQEIERAQEEIERLNQVRSRCSSTYALCLIDGDGYIFDKKFLEKGYEGGREAAAALTKQLHHDIDNNSTNLWTCVYYNHYGLRKALSKYQDVQEQTFDDFCDGFRSASQLIHMMDVGRKKEAADEKIKEMLRVFATAPQTKAIYFGGGHDSGYVGALSNCQNLGLEEKIVILKGYTEIAYDLRGLPFRVMDTDGLFMPEKMDAEIQGNSQTASTPQLAPTATNGNRTQNVASTATGSYASAATLAVPLPPPGRRSPSPGHTRIPSRDAGRGGQRRIDPSKPLYKQTPSICNYHVLSFRGCRNGSNCPHAHDYALTDQQKESLREYMLTVPCDHGDQCINEACILGHRCPGGRTCPRFQRGTCRFKDEQHVR